MTNGDHIQMSVMRDRVERHVGIGQPLEVAEAERVVDDAPGRVVEQLPEQADDRHRQHHRQQQQRRDQPLEAGSCG